MTKSELIDAIITAMDSRDSIKERLRGIASNHVDRIKRCDQIIAKARKARMDEQIGFFNAETFSLSPEDQQLLASPLDGL